MISFAKFAFPRCIQFLPTAIASGAVNCGASSLAPPLYRREKLRVARDSRGGDAGRSDAHAIEPDSAA